MRKISIEKNYKEYYLEIDDSESVIIEIGIKNGIYTLGILAKKIESELEPNWVINMNDRICYGYNIESYNKSVNTNSVLSKSLEYLFLDNWYKKYIDDDLVEIFKINSISISGYTITRICPDLSIIEFCTNDLLDNLLCSYNSEQLIELTNSEILEIRRKLEGMFKLFI